MHKFFGPLDDISFKINGRDRYTHVTPSCTRFRTLKPNSTRFRTRFLVLSPGGVSSKKHKIPGPIKTVVVLVMENCSFDHVLGWLKRSRPDIDELGGGEWNPLSTLDPSSPAVVVSDDALFIDEDPGHSFQAIREQIFRSNDTSQTPPPMNRFTQQAESMLPGFSKTVMSGFKPQTLPVYTHLANHFGIFDKWFTSVQTTANAAQLHQEEEGRGEAVSCAGEEKKLKKIWSIDLI